MRALHLASTLLLLIANSAPAAWAQQTPEGPGAAGQTDADKLAADHYLAGIRALEAGRDAEAHAELLKAWELKRHWQIAANLGEVELRLGKYREATEHLEYFLREAEGVREDEIRRAEEMLREARRHVEAEQRALKEAPAPAPAPAPEPAPAVATVSSAQVNGGAGQGGVGRGGGGEMAAGSRPLRWPVIAAASVGVVSIGVGVWLTIAANAKDDRADEELDARWAAAPPGQVACPGASCDRLNRLLQEEDRLGNAAIAAYAVGGVALAGAAALMIWPIRVGERGVQASVTPMAAPGGSGMFVTGKF